MTAETRTRRRWSGERSRWGGAFIAAALAIGVGAGAGAASHGDEIPVVRRTDVVPVRLDCEVVDRDAASIGCRWSTPDASAGYRLVRAALGSDHGRTTVARIDDPRVNSFVDSPVRVGVRFAYAVIAYDAAGRIIGVSRPAVVGIPVADDRTDVEVLRLECEATSTTTVRCAGGIPNSPARTLTLWRSIDGAHREPVAEYELPFPTSHGDVVPEGTRSVAYALLATDGSGEIVARSRAEYVELPLVRDRVSDRPAVTTTRPDTIRDGRTG